MYKESAPRRQTFCQAPSLVCILRFSTILLSAVCDIFMACCRVGNTGSFNKGNVNLGNFNDASANNGNLNKGNANAGSFNTGSQNNGNSNSGNQNDGTGNTGNQNTVSNDSLSFL